MKTKTEKKSQQKMSISNTYYQTKEYTHTQDKKQQEESKRKSLSSCTELKFSTKPKITFQQDVIDKIKYLCNTIDTKEWAAVLFYKTTEAFGSDKFSIKVVDLFPMAEGSSVYVEYETDADLIDYMMKNLHLLELNRAHLHSHNSMSVFFSGTDMSELKANCINYNYYLSVIVNNKLDIAAKIATKGEISPMTQIITYTGDNGEKLTVHRNIEVSDVILIYDCECSLTEAIKIPTTFAERVKSIIEKTKQFITTEHTQRSFIDSWTENRHESNIKEESDLSDFVAAYILRFVINLGINNPYKTMEAMQTRSLNIEQLFKNKYIDAIDYTAQSYKISEYRANEIFKNWIKEWSKSTPQRDALSKKIMDVISKISWTR